MELEELKRIRTLYLIVILGLVYGDTLCKTYLFQLLIPLCPLDVFHGCFPFRS